MTSRAIGSGEGEDAAAKRFLRISYVGAANASRGDYVVKKGKVQVGMAWWMTSKEDGEFLDTRFNDRLWGAPRPAILKMCACGSGADLVMLPWRG